MAGFYVKNTDGQLIPAGFLTDSLGNPVIDPNAAKTGPLSSTFYNYDGTFSEVSNSNNVMVASLGYSLNYSAAVGFLIEDSPPGVGILSMGVSFTQGTPQDLQRNYIDANGLPVLGAAPVPAFQDIASLHLGIVGYLGGIPQSITGRRGRSRHRCTRLRGKRRFLEEARGGCRPPTPSVAHDAPLEIGEQIAWEPVCPDRRCEVDAQNC